MPFLGSDRAEAGAKSGAEPRVLPSQEADPASGPVLPPFEQIYDQSFAFVWRSARRLGVEEAALDDVVQETFVIVHRRLGEFEGRSSLKTWIFGVLLRVVRDHRRTNRRKRPDTTSDPAEISDAIERSPHEIAAKSEAMQVLRRLLEELDDDKREVFVLAELEQLPMPDICAAVGGNVNTLHAKLRAARKQFENALARHRARDGWRLR